jgi:hypothetical protein
MRRQKGTVRALPLWRFFCVRVGSRRWAETADSRGSQGLFLICSDRQNGPCGGARSGLSSEAISGATLRKRPFRTVRTFRSDTSKSLGRPSSLAQRYCRGASCAGTVCVSCFAARAATIRNATASPCSLFFLIGSVSTSALLSTRAAIFNVDLIQTASKVPLGWVTGSPLQETVWNTLSDAVFRFRSEILGA